MSPDLSFGNFTSGSGDYYAQSSESPSLPNYGPAPRLMAIQCTNLLQTFANFSHLNGNSIQPTNCQIIFAVSLQIKDKNVFDSFTVDSSGQWSHRLIYRRNRVGHKWKYDARSTTWWQLMWNRCTQTLQTIVLSFDMSQNTIFPGFGLRQMLWQ